MKPQTGIGRDLSQALFEAMLYREHTRRLLIALKTMKNLSKITAFDADISEAEKDLENERFIDGT